LARELRVEARVSLPGQVQHPATVLARADLFVLSSRYEGFPMALVEAMACGLAAIATDCPSGPREIVQDGVDAVLVPPEDVEALAATMDRLMADDAERQRMGARAGEVVERFGIERISTMWDELFAAARRSAA
jgi:glycosyltransferase involved in cell wall biosynthesis